MKKIIYSLLVVILGMAITSCSSLDEESSSVLPPDAIQFTGEILPLLEEDGTRAFIDESNSTLTIWQVGDVMSVFATTGPQQSQVEYVVSEVDEEEPTKCVFTPGAYCFKEGFEFASYYPLQKDYFRYTDDIPVGAQPDAKEKVWTLSGQTQSTNNNTRLLSDYWLMVALPSSEGYDHEAFHFHYDPALALVYTDFIVPKEGTWKTFTINAPAGCSFYEDGVKYNFSQGGIKTSGATPINHIDLTLSTNGAGIKATLEEDGKYHLRLFMIVCPTEMTGKNLVVYATDEDGNPYSCVISGKNASGADRSFFKAKTRYKLAGTLAFDDDLTTGTITDFEEEEDKSSVDATITDFTEELDESSANGTISDFDEDN